MPNNFGFASAASPQIEHRPSAKSKDFSFHLKTKKLDF